MHLLDMVNTCSILLALNLLEARCHSIQYVTGIPEHSKGHQIPACTQLVAQLINYGAVNITHNGWRLSYALAAVPALPVVLGGILCPETPSWYLEKGNVQAARKVK